MPLRSRPDAMHHAVTPVLDQQIGVSITRKPSANRCCAQRTRCRAHPSAAFPADEWRLAYRAGPCARPRIWARPPPACRCPSARLNDCLVNAFGVQINPDAAAALDDAVHDRFPNCRVPLGHTAFTVGAEGDAADRGTRREQQAQSVAAIRRLGVRQ